MVEHEAAAGHGEPAPPGPGTARGYLARADAVVERRERIVDRRVAAWVTIANAAFLAVYFTLAVQGVRQGTSSIGFQSLLPPALLASQIGAGAMQRDDRGSRRRGAGLLVTTGGVAVIAAALFVFFLIMMNEEVPTAWIILPTVTILLAFGGYGVIQLVRASRGPRRLPPAHAPLDLGGRWGTILVGLFLGAVCALSGAPDDVLRGVLLVLVFLVLIAWSAASGTPIGLPRLGACWRWPHLLALGSSLALLIVLRIPTFDGVPVAPGTFLLAAFGMVLVFVVVSTIPGRDLDA